MLLLWNTPVVFWGGENFTNGPVKQDDGDDDLFFLAWFMFLSGV
jgi:hypothetical protein